jgi:outer membrane beta-barrel protein
VDSFGLVIRAGSGAVAVAPEATPDVNRRRRVDGLGAPLLAGLAALVALAAPAHAQAPKATDAAAAPAAGSAPAVPTVAPPPAPAPTDAPAASTAPALRTTQVCIDAAIANRLAVKRQRREAVDRLFVKQARHELSATGGYYQSDLFSGTYVAGGSYTYHMTENTAVEFGAAYTHANADIIRAIEDSRGTVIGDEFDRVLLLESLLVWTPIYGKLRLGGSIVRFDINAGLGVGVVDAATSRGAAGVAGLGMKLFIGRALAFRIDARNHVFQQELLDESFLVKDLSITSGLSLFLPMRN